MKLFSKKPQDLPGRRRSVVGDKSTPRDSLSGAIPELSDVFRRNRTITGTTSNNLNSPMYRSSDLASSRIQAHHLSGKRQKVFGLFLIVASVSLALWMIVSNFTSRASISVSNSQNIVKVVDSSYYSGLIQDYLNSNPSGRFQFLLDQASLSQYMTSKAPEIQTIVQLGMSNIGETSFALTMRKPVAGWQIVDKQYYVDSNGVSFEKNYYIDPVVQIVDNSGASINTGSAVVSNKLLSFVGRVVAISSSYGHTVTKATLPPGTTREVDITLQGTSYYVKLLVDRPVGEQVEDMSNAIKYLKKSGNQPKYIDVRVSGKAFYK